MRDLAEANKKSLYYKFNMHTILNEIEKAHIHNKIEDIISFSVKF